jgi:hypothetical protein
MGPWGLISNSQFPDYPKGEETFLIQLNLYAYVIQICLKFPAPSDSHVSGVSVHFSPSALSQP